MTNRTYKRQCAVCDVAFIAIRHHTKWCSDACRTEGTRIYRSPRRKRPLKERECIVCHTVFMTRNSRRITCSVICSREHSLLYQKLNNRKTYRGHTKAQREAYKQNARLYRELNIDMLRAKGREYNTRQRALAKAALEFLESGLTTGDSHGNV